MKNIVVFGGSGFVGSHLVDMVQDEKNIDKVLIADILKPDTLSGKCSYVKIDIRNKIPADAINEKVDCIVNLAAVHKTPGHPSHEYFDTNIRGAENICSFAKARKIDKIVFTSSISVYGPDEEEKSEDSITKPNIPYGISKIIAEFIHHEWYMSSPNRHLTIIRPAVIFGKGEKGNFTRIAHALRKRVFIYPGRKDTVKSCCYVKDISRFIMDKVEQGQGYSLYNFCYPEKITLERVCLAFHDALEYKMPIASIPQNVVKAGVAVAKKIDMPFINKLGLHPERISKLVNSTNISSTKLMDSGFSFKYDLVSAIKDWSNDCSSNVLY